MWYALLSYIKQNSAVAPIGVKKRKEIQIRLIDRNKKSLKLLATLVKTHYISIFPNSQIYLRCSFSTDGQIQQLTPNLHSVA